jgi:hypothetical protein
MSFYYSLLYGAMAEKTLYLMVSNMIFVKKLVGVLCFEDLPLIVTPETCVFLHMTIAGDDVCVARFALHASFNKLFVIEIEIIDSDITACFKMTGCATGKIVFLALTFLEMTDKTVFLGYCHMSSLYDLGMAGGASKLHISFHLVQVLDVVKYYVFEHNLFIEGVSIVTTALEAAQIVNFSVRPGNNLAGDKINERYLPVLPFTDQVVPEPRFVVT